MNYIGDEHLDEQDRQALRLDAAMRFRVDTGGTGSFYPRDPAKAADIPIARPEDAMHLAKRLGIVALWATAWAAAWYFPAWPWLVAKLGAL